jgi:uncharacterized protein YbaR (Trm112 family)
LLFRAPCFPHLLTCATNTHALTHTPPHQQPTKQQKQLGCAQGLPRAVDPDVHPRDDVFLRALHHALLEVALVEGALVCPETGRRFPVKKGIPNMLLHEDEC